MLSNLTGWHALVILTIVLLVFGSAKLPTLARSVGQSMRILKDETRQDAPVHPSTRTVGEHHSPGPVDLRRDGAATQDRAS